MQSLNFSKSLFTILAVLIMSSLAISQGVLSGVEKQAAALKDNVSKSEVLDKMNNFDGLGLTDSEKSQVEDINSNAVDQLFSIASGGFSSKELTGKLTDLKKDTQKKMKNVLGDKKFKKAKKHVKKQLRPVTRKVKLVKWLL